MYKRQEKHGNYVTEVEGGYRRIVAAPKPQGIIEIDSIKALSDQGQVVIACGGGGIPVLAQGVELHGASAVIEKDYASGRMAELLNADALMILTSVEHVCVGYNTDQEVPLEHISAVSYTHLDVYKRQVERIGKHEQEKSSSSSWTQSTRNNNARTVQSNKKDSKSDC